jgi:hypothetical protein
VGMKQGSHFRIEHCLNVFFQQLRHGSIHPGKSLFHRLVEPSKSPFIPLYKRGKEGDFSGYPSGTFYAGIPAIFFASAFFCSRLPWRAIMIR